MKFDKNTIKKSMALYAVTDRECIGARDFFAECENSIKGGATFFQLREKNLDNFKFLQVAEKVKIITDSYNIPFVINDNLEVARLCGADGVHIGQSDAGLKYAREVLGKDKIIGVSAQTVAQAVEAELNGADYIGVGAVFGTSTKKDADSVSLVELKDICASVKIPVVAIGGINEYNLRQLAGIGVDGVAVVSCIFAKDDVLKATESLRALIKESLGV